MNQLLVKSLFTLSSIVSTCLPLMSNTGTIKSTNYEKSTIQEDILNSDFDLNKYVLNKNIEDSKSIIPLTLIHDHNDLYLYLVNQNGKSLTDNVVSTRISMSLNDSTYEDTSYYLLSYLDSSNDNLYYKYKVNCDGNIFSFSKQFHISEIEFDYGTGYAKGRQETIAQSYYYDSVDDINPSSSQALDVINLEVSPENYRTNTINSNGCFTDIFYITFPVNKSYGDLVGLKLSWKEKSINYYGVYLDPVNGGLNDYYSMSDQYVIDFKDTDFLESYSLNSTSNGWQKFVNSLNMNYWFYDKDTDYKNINVIEKINFDTTGQYNNYYLNDNTKQKLLSDTVDFAVNNYYAIRFAIKDFWWKQSNNVVGDVVLSKYNKTEIKDCDVLTLTFKKNEKVYTLMASSKPVEHDPGTKMPDSKLTSWWNQLNGQLQNLLKIVGIVLGAVIGISILSFILKALTSIINFFKVFKRRK